MFTFDSDKFVDREKILEYILEKISRLARGDPFAPDERVVHIIGPSGIGKSCLLEKCYKVFSNNPIFIPVLIKLEDFKEQNDDYIDKVLETTDKLFSYSQGIPAENRKGKTPNSFGPVVTSKINKYIKTKDKVVILLIDEINIPNKKDLHNIEEYLLERLLQDNRKVVIITAGRSPAGLNVFELRPKPENTIVLAAFDEKTTGDQVERLMPGAGILAEKIHNLGNGVPKHNKKLVGHAAGDPLTIPDDLQAIQSLTRDIKQEIEERFHFVIEAICILPNFHPDDATPLLEKHPELGMHWDESKVKQVFLELKQIQIGPGGLINWDREKKSWVMDEPTRALFERELKMRDPELWGKLHFVTYQMYKNWGEDFNSQLFKDKAVYHQQCLQSAGMDYEGLEG